MRYLPITSCEGCPHRAVSPDYTADSWERPERWDCNKAGGENIVRYQEWSDKPPAVPKWCPLPDTDES